MPLWAELMACIRWEVSLAMPTCGAEVPNRGLSFTRQVLDLPAHQLAVSMGMNRSVAALTRQAPSNMRSSGTELQLLRWTSIR